MATPLQLLLVLAFILAASKVSGALVSNLNMPAILGELSAGILLGPTVFNLLGISTFQGSHVRDFIFDLAQIGVILIMFIAGLESDAKKLQEVGRASALTALFGVITPLLLSYFVATAFGYNASTAIFIGIILTATSVTITSETLRELGALKGRIGSTLLGAAVVDDVLGLLAFSLFFSVTVGGNTGLVDILLTIGRMTLFIGGSVFLGWRIIPLLTVLISNWSRHAFRQIDESGSLVAENESYVHFMISFAIAVGLAFSWSAEVVGSLAGITGAYLAGFFFSRTSLREVVIHEIKGLVYGYFAPIFFISIGLQADVRMMGLSLLPFALAIVGVAITSKLIGCSFGARLGGMTSRESLQIGVGMISRGEVGLIIASNGIAQGLIKQDVYIVIVLVVLVSSLITPFSLNIILKNKYSTNA